MCIICGGNKHKKTMYGGYRYLDIQYDIVACSDCGFMFVDPLPKASVLDEVYKNSDYFDNYYIHGAKTTNYLDSVNYVSVREKNNMKILKKFKSSGRLLDVGCAGGRFLKIAKEAGYDCVGIEPNPEMSAFVEKELGIPVKNANINNGLFKDAEFDVIHLGDVVEHLTNPEESLSLVTKWLAKDGILFMEQPLTYNRSLFNLFLKLNMLVSKNRYTNNPPLHIWEFTPKTLKHFLSKQGYRVLHREVFENRAKSLAVYKSVNLKNRLAHLLKDLASFVSSLPMLRFLRLGDRAIFICQKKTTRTLFVHPNLDVGGAESNRLSVLKNINRDKNDLTVCCLSHKGKIAGEIEKIGVAVHCLNSSESIFNIRTTFSLYRFIKKGKFDIVHTCLSNTNIHGRIAAKLAGVPIIISEEQSDYERYNARFSFLFRALNHFLSLFTDKVICCSENVRHSLSKSENIPLDKIVSIHNCLDTSSFYSTKSRSEARVELGLGENSPVLAYVASLATRKGHETLLSILESIKLKFANVVLLLVGKGPLRGNLEILVKQKRLSDNVVFLGERRDVPDILAAVDVFVSSAQQEAFGINIIEAMYMGVPCVAMKVGGVPEIIDHQVNGMLVHPGEKEQMAQTVIDLLSKREKISFLGKNARQKVSECFTSQKYAERLESVYDNLLLKKNEKV